MSMANSQAMSPSMGARKAPLLLSLGLIAGGLLLLGWLGWDLLNSTPKGVVPYHYELVAEGAVDAFPELGLEAYEGLSIRKYELRAEKVDKDPLVVFHTGSRGDQSSPILLDWQNTLGEPLLKLLGPTEELAALAKAVTKHVPPEAIILSWWDTSRRLELLTGVETLFKQNFVRPLLLPSAWERNWQAIEALERQFWEVPTSSGVAEARYEDFTEALLAEEAAGVAKLRELAGKREAYVVVHWSDTYKLGGLRPGRFGIGYKDFNGSLQNHGVISHIKQWANENGHAAYFVQRPNGETLRVYYLLNETAKDTLIAKLLPFNTSNPMEFEPLRLVAQYKGYWVYSLPPAES